MAKLTPALRPWLLPVLAVRRDQFAAVLCRFLVERAGVVSFVTYEPPGSLGGKNFGERLSDKGDFMRAGRRREMC